MASSVDLLTSFNFHSWKGDMDIQLCARGLYRVTMDIEEEPASVIDKVSFLNKKDESFRFLRVYQLENELMSLQPSNSETLNEFFTNFKHTVLLLRQCKVEKVDDQLILAILSKLGADYSVFVSTFRVGKLTTLDGRCLHSTPSLSP